MKTIKKIILTAVAFAATSTLAFAQIYQPESVESEASRGIFTGDVDDFFSTINWQNLEFEKVFAEATLQGEYLDAGLGFNMGKVYGAIYYNGNFVNTKINKESGTITTVTLANGATTTDNLGDFEYNTNDLEIVRTTTLEPYNNIAMMLGIGKVGIKLGYYTTGSVTKTKKKTPGTIEENSGTDESEWEEKEWEEKYYVPFVGLGLNFGKVKPYLDFALPIYKTGKKGTWSGSGYFPGGTWKTTANWGDDGDYNNAVINGSYDVHLLDGIGSYIGINPTLGVEFDFGEEVEQCLNISYSPYIYLYNGKPRDWDKNKLDYLGASYNNKESENSVTGISHEVNVQNDENDPATPVLYFSSRSRMINDVDIDYTLNKEIGERVTIGALFGAGVSIDVRKNTKGTVQYTYADDILGSDETETISTGFDGKYTELYIEPKVGVAVKFAARPEKINLIFGANVSFNLYWSINESTFDPPYRTITTTTKNSLTGTTTEKTYKAVNGGAPILTQKNFFYETNYAAYFAAEFTPIENFGFSTGVNLVRLCTQNSGAPFASFVVQAKVKF